MLLVAFTGIGAARVPSAEPAALCIPLLMNCSTPTPTPSPTPTQAPGSPVQLPIPLLGDTPAAPGSTPATPTPIIAIPDTGAPVFTQPAAQLGGSSIVISGLKSISVVTVPLIDGTTTPALKIVADDVVVNDFLLDVRRATGPSLVTNATRMELNGDVQVYLDSATATLGDGTGLTFGAATPPPGDELPSTLLRVNLGLIGVTADSIRFTAPHQSLHE